MTPNVRINARAFTILAHVAVCLGPSACNGTEPQAIQYVFPQTTGVKWTYGLVDTVEIGSDVVREPSTWAIRSLRDTVMSGMHWIQIDSLTQLLYNFGKSAARYWIGQNGSGVYLTYRRVGPFDTASEAEKLLFKYPVERGESGLDTDGIPWVVPTVDTLVETPAGRFHCIRYDRPAINETYFVAPGTGIVRKLYIASSSKNSQGEYTRLVRGIVTLSAIEGVNP